MYDGKNLRCNKCHKIIDLDSDENDWFSAGFDENFHTRDFCRSCSVKLPDPEGQTARFYFESHDLAQKLIKEKAEKSTGMWLDGTFGH
jgi:hypothetical protein